MRVQISHSPENREFVDQLDAYLWRIGVEPRRDYLKSPEALKNPERLDQQLRRYDYVIVVLSRAYVNDEWLMTELLQSIVRERLDQREFILPLLVEDCDVPLWLRDRVVDFRTSPFEEAVVALPPVLAGLRQVFVVMKFGDVRLDSMYEMAIKPAVLKLGFSPLRIDELENAGSITDQTLHEIERSTVVLADLTGERPNCYFEAGYAHALGRQLILTIRRGEPIHFNLADRRFIEWETEKELFDALIRRLEAIRATLPGGGAAAAAA
jgi:TIR domain